MWLGRFPLTITNDILNCDSFTLVTDNDDMIDVKNSFILMSIVCHIMQYRMSHAFSGCDIFQWHFLLRLPVVLNIVFVGQVHEASVLFLDNPVGAGFSYVNESLGNYTTNIQEITEDLVSFTRQFIDRFPQFSANVSSFYTV